MGSPGPDAGPPIDIRQNGSYTLGKAQEVSMAVEEDIGQVNDFFARPVVAGIEATGTLKVGDTVHIKGHTTDITMVVESMEVNNVKIQVANARDSIGVKVTDRVRRGDRVYLVRE